MQKVYLLIIGIISIGLITGVGFLLLHQNKPSSSLLSVNISNPNAPFRRQDGGRGFRNLPAGSKPIFGQITTISDKNITLQGRTGDLTIIISDATKFSMGKQADLKIGDRLIGYGTANSDGTVNAQQLTINPNFPRRGDGGTNPNTTSPQTPLQNL